MDVTHLSYSDSWGGAARAAYRLHAALRRFGLDSRMVVDDSRTGDFSVEAPKHKVNKALALLRPQLSRVLTASFSTNNFVLHSPSFLPSGRASSVNQSTADVVNLHWVQGEMLSIRDIAQIRKPVVWTLHDMWAFCGAEHYTEDNRWSDGYSRANRPHYESGFDLNRWTWERKRKHWENPLQIVCPSRWLADCVRSSKLMSDWPVEVIPNPIDLNAWSPVDKNLARDLIGLPHDVPILLFGAMGGGRDPRKGFIYLRDALTLLASEQKDLELVVFGEMEPKSNKQFGLKTHYVGHLFDELSLKVLYSAVDVFTLPSRQDNLPNTGVESLACGTPVVAFDTCGLSDIVAHKRTGYLAKAFEADDLANGIKWVLANAEHLSLRATTREFALANFSSQKIAEKYTELYRKVLSGN